MNNLETFNLIAAMVFAKCYAEFPAEIEINMSDFPLDFDEERKRALFHGTMRWLARHGWITVGRGLRDAYWTVQLTEKSLVALGWTPGPLRFIRRPSIGERLVAATGKGALRDVAGKLVLEALKMAM